MEVEIADYMALRRRLKYRFFHLWASQRRKRNLITKLRKPDGQVKENEGEMAEFTLGFYKGFFLDSRHYNSLSLEKRRYNSPIWRSAVIISSLLHLCHFPHLPRIMAHCQFVFVQGCMLASNPCILPSNGSPRRTHAAVPRTSASPLPEPLLSALLWLPWP